MSCIVTSNHRSIGTPLLVSNVYPKTKKHSQDLSNTRVLMPLKSGLALKKILRVHYSGLVSYILIIVMVHNNEKQVCMCVSNPVMYHLYLVKLHPIKGFSSV